MSNPFDYLNAINTTKEALMTGSDNDVLAERGYKPYLVNRGLSYFPDTVLLANEMNLHSNLDKKPQFCFLLHITRPRKRFSKWFKPNQSDDLTLVSEYYGYSIAKAEAVMPIMTDEQLEIMRTKMEKGGS
jgi:hypothetical protein